MGSWGVSLGQGVLQGLTEYLPVSSSGHLALFQHAFGFQGPALAFDLVLHVATMLATICFFARDIVGLTGEFASGFISQNGRRSDGWRFGWAVVIGTIVTACIGLPLKPAAEAVGDSPRLVGVMLLITAGLTALPMVLSSGRNSLNWKIGLIVGIAQGIAVLPGISRSGATIVVALFCGLAKDEAFRFSFLLSLPAILGAALLELRDVSLSLLPSGWVLGFAAAFLFGLFALAVVRRLVTSEKWIGFSLYCLIIGVTAIVWPW